MSERSLTFGTTLRRMQLTNDFAVGVPADEAWRVLTDLERIAPCLPGAQLQEVDGDDYIGTVKVKVGPITAHYAGKARFVERDESGRRAVLAADGRDKRGQGNASAKITATLTPAGDRTEVSVVTDLNVSGKVAQFGRGVLAEVSAKLMDQFVANLESEVLSAPADEPPTATATASTGGAPSTPAAAAGAPTPRDEVEAVDVLQLAGGSAAKRAVPLVGVLVVLGLGLLLWRRRRRRRQ